MAIKRIEVAVGILYDELSRVLVGQRTVKDQYYQKWEFPGGKLELGENVETALAREFKEEVGIKILSSKQFMELEHDYLDRKVRLHIRTVESYTGAVQALEGQALDWVSLQELNTLDFLQGNQAIIRAVQERAGIG